LGLQVIDLNRYIFNGIVELCRKEKLISEELGHSFLTNHSVSVDRRFIELYRGGRLHEFDFEKCKINIFDHRKLTEMLVSHNPEKYMPLNRPEQPYDFVKESQEFLREIYEMGEIEYRTECEEQVRKYYQCWWGGPEKLSPLVNPPIKFYETEEGQKIRIERESAIPVETLEEQRDRTRRINTQRTTPQDLKDIASSLKMKLFGPPVKI